MTRVAAPDRLEAELSGLDALESVLPPRKTRRARAWFVLWPKVAAAGIFVLFWQLVVWSGWKPDYVLAGPADVFPRFWDDLGINADAAATTLQSAVVGFAIALLVGTVVGIGVARSKILRSALGSMITGLQTMPSIAWFPLAIVVFQLSSGAITFVVVIGAAPSIANGVIGGIDHIPPVLLRAGRVLGARGFASLRHVVLPAALPSFVAGLKQGWAFAWRSLLAGELLVLIQGRPPGLGRRLDVERQLNSSAGVMAVMMMIFIIGVVIDACFFGTLDRWIRRRYGLIDEAATA